MNAEREAALKALRDAEAALAKAEAEAAAAPDTPAATPTVTPDPPTAPPPARYPVLEKRLYLPNHLGPVAVNGG